MKYLRREVEVEAASEGFSHLECLCVVAIVSVLFALAGKVFYEAGASCHIHQAKGLLAELVLQTRLQALRDHAQRCLCLSQEGQRCEPHWQGNHLMIADASGQQLLPLSWPNPISLHWQGNLAHNGPLCFKPLGFSAGQKGHFVLRCGGQVERLWVDFRGNVFGAE